MRVVYLAHDVYGLGGTEQAVVAQANAMARLHEVEIVSVYRSRSEPYARIAPDVTVTNLVSVMPDRDVAWYRRGLIDDDLARLLRGRPSVLVPAAWDPNYDALADVALEDYLPKLSADVAVTFAPALMGVASQLVPPATALVHQEHRSPSQREHGLAPLLTFGQRADVIALLTEDSARWLAPRLGPAAPEIVVIPNALPPGFRPRARLDLPVIVAAGRLVRDKQFDLMVDAFAAIHDRIPHWRLRIFGTGSARTSIRDAVLRHGLYDKVELPGATPDMISEWARAGIAALTSAKEGLPLVIQEAMAAGVPVVGFDCNTGPRDLIEHERNGLLVAPGSVPGMAESLLRLATDDALRRRLGAGAVLTAAAFDSPAITGRWVDVFESAVNARRRLGSVGRVSGRLRHVATHGGAGVAAFAEDAEPPLGETTLPPTRGALLGLAATVAASVTKVWFVLPPTSGEAPVVIVPSHARDAYLASLARAQVPAGAALREPAQHGWPERRGSVGRLAEQLRKGRTPVLYLEPAPGVSTHAASPPPRTTPEPRVSVEFWDTGPDGALHAPGADPAVRRLPPGLPTSTAVVDGVKVPILSSAGAVPPAPRA